MKIGLALSGGSVRGIAHLGVLKALSELNIKPDILSGTSAGSIVGAMYAAGYSPDDILKIFVSNRFLTYFRPAFGKGLIKMDNLEKLYLEYFPDNSFEKLNLPITINATDLNNGRTVYFSSGELIKPILASCCIPVMFEPVVFQGNTYVDGGILNNLSVEPLVGKCDFIIGVHTNPYDTTRTLGSIRAIMERSLLLAVQTNVKERIKYCNVFLEPPDLHKFTTFDIGKAKDIFEVGYQYTISNKELIELGRKNSE